MRGKRGKRKYQMKSGDFILVILVMGLVIFGVIMVFSASYYNSISESGDPYAYLKRDCAWAVVGVAAMIFMALYDYHHLARIAPAMLIISLIMLAMVFSPLGVTSHGATRWIGLKLGSKSLTIMPGEVAKVCAIVFVAWYLSKDGSRIRSLTRGVLPLFALTGVYFGMIILQPNMSTAITVSGIIVGMMFVAGLNLFYLFAVAGLGGAGAFGLILAEPYRLKRLVSFLDPFKDAQNTGYQVVQSLLALGSGGVFGVGLGKSIQKTLYLPEPQNDFIFAIIGEELGYVGCILLIIAYILLIWRGCHIALNAPDLFGTLLASGITIMLAIQVILNIAVVTSSMPPTGVVLPFVSYGGNALLLFLGSMGVLLNISRHTPR